MDAADFLRTIVEEAKHRRLDWIEVRRRQFLAWFSIRDLVERASSLWEATPMMRLCVVMVSSLWGPPSLPHRGHHYDTQPHHGSYSVSLLRLGCHYTSRLHFGRRSGSPLGEEVTPSTCSASDITPSPCYMVDIIPPFCFVESIAPPSGLAVDITPPFCFCLGCTKYSAGLHYPLALAHHMLPITLTCFSLFLSSTPI